MTSFAISLKVGTGGFPSGSVCLDRVDPAGDELPRFEGPLASLLEPNRWIGAQALILPNAGRLVAQDPLLATHLAHKEVQAVAIAMPARLGRLHFLFRKPGHPRSHIWSHTSTRIVAHSDGQGKIVSLGMSVADDMSGLGSARLVRLSEAFWRVLDAPEGSRGGCAHGKQTVRKLGLSGFLRGVGDVRIAHDPHRRIRTGPASVVAGGG